MIMKLCFITFIVMTDLQVYISDLSMYEATYHVPLIVLKLVGLRLTRKDSRLAGILWATLYWFGVINMIVAVTLEGIYMAEVAKGGTFDDAVEIFRMMPCFGYVMMAAIKSYKLYCYRPVYENLVSELRSMWPQGPVTKEEYDLLAKPVKRLSIINKGCYWGNHLLLFFFITPHIVDVFKRWMGQEVDLKLPFFFWLPFDSKRLYVYESLLILQTWQALVTVWLIQCWDLLFCVFMSHLSTQFDLLSVRIRKMVYVPADKQMITDYPLAQDSQLYQKKYREPIETFGHKDWENRHMKELTEIILRHRALIRLSGDVETQFSFQLLVNFLNSSVIICFCGFCCVIVEQISEPIYKTFLTTALTQTWLLCWYGQRLIDSSTSIGSALYNSGWYMACQKVKSNIFIILHRSQKSVHVTTYGFSVISLATYTTIIKTAWSYFTLLLNTYKID